MKNTSFNTDIVNHAIEGLQSISEGSIYGCDLHHELFNTDYFIIGYYQCEQWLKDNKISIFEAIREVQEYEKMNFGEHYTDISSSEKLVNMYAYIQGELLLSQSETLSKNWDNKLDEDDIKNIIEELEELL